MKVFCGRNKKGVWKASLDESKLFRFDNVFESEVEAIHNNRLYMIKTYYGYDYNYTGGTMYDENRYVFQLFHSVSATKKNKTWKEREEVAKKNPEDYHVTQFSIASDNFGEPFIFGDVMEGKFNMKIFPVRVI